MFCTLCSAHTKSILSDTKKAGAIEAPAVQLGVPG